MITFFKAMLTRPESDLIRNSMISAFTGLDIVDSTVIENEPALNASILEKQVHLDVFCKTADGKRINIEMQAHAMEYDTFENKRKNLRARSVYYISRIFAGQDADYYSDLNQTFQIMICDFDVFNDDQFMHKFRYTDNDTLLSDLCCIIYVELPKIKKILDKPFSDMTAEERWGVLIEFADDMKFSVKASEFESREEFKMAIKVLSNISKNEIEQAGYISRLKYTMDKAQEMHDATQAGVEIGLKKGMKAGIHEQSVKTALAAISMNLSLDQVVALSGLELSEVEALMKSGQQ
jgi:predicted transposase/invertase (TIGR01784 family)